jgi:hypothetical protein
MWYPLDLVTFLGFFSPLISGPIVVELEPKSRIVSEVVAKVLICSPVIKTGESLWVGNLGAVPLVVIWVLGSRVRSGESRPLTLGLVIVGLLTVVFIKECQ